MTKQKNMNQIAMLVIALLILMTTALVGLFQSARTLTGNNKSIEMGQSAVLIASEQLDNSDSRSLLYE